jgi:hypothetical protein
MAERNAKGDGQQRAFDMRSLLRLGLWGASASAALALTVLTAYSTTGSQRLQPAKSQSNGERPSGSSPAQPAGRAAEIAGETQRLSEAVRAMTSDRDRLLTRIATLERGLEDITGAIKRPSADSSSEGSSTIAAAPPPATAQPRATGPDTIAPGSPYDPGAATPQAAAPSSANWMADAPAADPVVEPEPVRSSPEFGVDIGGATSFEGLRVLWNSTRRANSALFEGLNPLVIVRESKTHAADLRLIAGPLPDKAAAARMCVTLSAARRNCQPASFEGQQFTFTPDPERRPATPPKPAPSPQPRSTLRLPHP